MVRTGTIQTSITRGVNGQPPNAFSNLEELKISVRPPRPGETGVFTDIQGTPRRMQVGLCYSF